ncbi:hypothetical protein, partial [Klebsiella pneumoniae]|uniref:hypothetical protein n=1 Tax=Klebsiella pneumoniae TaxID=573 RepID=UPI003853BB83
STPTITRVDADFTQNLTNGLVLNDANNLTTDFKFAISTCLDDSHSTLWCDPSLNRGARLYNLLTQIFNRSSVDWTVTSNSKLLGSTFMDFWVYGVK